MTLEEAIKQTGLIFAGIGTRILLRRESWSLGRTTAPDDAWQLSEGDLSATDWEVVAKKFYGKVEKVTPS